MPVYVWWKSRTLQAFILWYKRALLTVRSCFTYGDLSKNSQLIQSRCRDEAKCIHQVMHSFATAMLLAVFLRYRSFMLVGKFHPHLILTDLTFLTLTHSSWMQQCAYSAVCKWAAPSISIVVHWNTPVGLLSIPKNQMGMLSVSPRTVVYFNLP